ncbi:ribosome maturation factor RimM [Vitiosangium sp. GDMCC 1.1324]|uniref:ribosome maturation factor RimM n=1 Tax=Vitiosangium sp. (strain GDMCC 1.1324) TaxID=2138576 RepID=UPI000D346030|nr:ribosome maturation factor RimM [Vitiosangium sp. GDMCC 1.1324]PTL80797.1 16S rRNA processing protein RimM [Vitiosangium sp. GDMCC 1.1324]
MTLKSHLELGYVARAHGLRGEVAVRAFDPESETLDYVPRVLVRTRAGVERVLRIESVRPTPKETLVVFEAVQGRQDAEALVGATVLAFREDLEPPSEDEYFQGDLVGLTAVDESGNVLGRVEELWSTGEVPNLVIRAEGKEELVVPFADDFVSTVDIPGGRLVVKPPEYLEAEGDEREGSED